MSKGIRSAEPSFFLSVPHEQIYIPLSSWRFGYTINSGALVENDGMQMANSHPETLYLFLTYSSISLLWQLSRDACNYLEALEFNDFLCLWLH